MRVLFKKIDKTVIHKSKVTDEHTVVVSTSEDGRKCLLIPTSEYTHGMNSSCTTKRYTAKTIDEKGLQTYDLDEEKNLKDWVEHCEKKNYIMDVFNSLKEAINSIF